MVKFRERPRDRFLTEEEFRRLGRVLDEAETRECGAVHAVAAIRLLLLTGCRKGENLNLRWDRVDLEANELRLPDAKTGPRTIPLSPEAAGVLAAVPHMDGNPFVIPGKIKGKAMRNLNDPWEIVCERAGLEDVRIHDAPQLRQPGAGARGVAADDRPAARPQRYRDNGPLRPSGARLDP